MRPTFIVGNVEFEKFSVSGTFGQKQGMVFVRVFGIPVFSETFSLCIIIVIHPFALPWIMAFDTEMIVRFLCQLAGSGSRLDKTLRQSDTGRDFIPFLMFDGNIFVFAYIIEIDGIFRLWKHRCDNKRQQADEGKFPATVHILGHKSIIKIGGQQIGFIGK